jgi:hypothetical protein
MMAMVSIVLRFSANALELFFELFQILVRKLFKIHKFISRAFDGANNLIKFQMNGFGIAVLGVLNQKHHEEGNNRRSGVDDELPGVGEMKSRPSEAPHGDDEHGSGKGPGAAENNRRLARENAKGIPYNAKEIPVPFVFC